jgi:hypothetical protein
VKQIKPSISTLKPTFQEPEHPNDKLPKNYFRFDEDLKMRTLILPIKTSRRWQTSGLPKQSAYQVSSTGQRRAQYWQDITAIHDFQLHNDKDDDDTKSRVRGNSHL